MSYLEVSFPQQFLYLSYKYAEYCDINTFFFLSYQDIVSFPVWKIACFYHSNQKTGCFLTYMESTVDFKSQTKTTPHTSDT